MMDQMTLVHRSLLDRVEEGLQAAQADDAFARIWQKDATLWSTDEEARKGISNSLGWLSVADEMLGVADELTEFAHSIRSSGFRHVMVCGMGGSSLCPEVLAKTFGPQKGFPELLVLDSTDPDVIADLGGRIDVEHCLFVVASKSGSTTEPNVFYKYWYDEVGKRRENPGENFIAITDPGSPLVEAASELKFRHTFLNQPDIGGRYSALSYFGMVPAALMGLDIRKLLERASAAKALAEENALPLGVMLGEFANAGRDKLTLVIDPEMATLGLWIEQLIAESTGKKGTGIVPVNGEVLGKPEFYGPDRVFVSISTSEFSATQEKLTTIGRDGHPLIFRRLNDVYDLGAEFFLWEFATAVAGWRMGINPFDQPNVQEAKDATKEILSSFERRGQLDPRTEVAKDDFITIYGAEESAERSVTEVLRAHLGTLRPGDYIAFLNYIEETEEVDQQFQQLRTDLSDRTLCAVTIGYGPRFLHSTGQLHKGGPDTGVFFQIIANDSRDFAVPGEPFTFSILKQAQALGDFRALAKRGRRVIGIDLGDNTAEGLAHLACLLV